MSLADKPRPELELLYFVGPHDSGVIAGSLKIPEGEWVSTSFYSVGMATALIGRDLWRCCSRYYASPKALEEELLKLHETYIQRGENKSGVPYPLRLERQTTLPLSTGTASSG